MSVLPLPDAKEHVNFKGTENDVELQRTIDAAEAYIANRVGPLVPVAVTERVTVTSSGAISLNTTPVINIASITSVVGGSSYSTGSLAVDDSGIVTVNSGVGFTPGVYDVTYQAGWSDVPDDLMQAIREMVRHLWRPQRGGTARGSAGSETRAPGYLVPNAVAEILDNYETVDGFA